MNFDIATMGFDADWWAAHWWLMFPIFGFFMMFYSMWLHHRRQRTWMEVMKTYAAQGKEPPANIANAAMTDSWGNSPRYNSFYSGRRLPFFDVRRGIFFAVLAGAFGYLYYHDPIRNDGFGIAAVIIGALAVAYLLIALIPRPKMDEPPKPNGQ
jgi:hypothetical protein